MRSLQRPRAHLPTLTGDGDGARAAQRNLTRTERRFVEHWNKPDVRGALLAMQGRICAYCGERITMREGGDVDHYRPKGRVIEDPDHGGYWWLAYAFENYLHSCKRCNQGLKKDHFPLRDSARNVRYEARDQLPSEGRLLLHPCEDPVDEWLQVSNEADRVELHGAGMLSPAAQAQVAETGTIFRWNRDPELLKARRDVLDAVACALEQGRDNEARALAVRY
jgi:uncharacterized protein (TIGR02646 family)